MATYTYTGFLTDLGENPFPAGAAPELVAIAQDGFGPKGLVAGALREVPVPIQPDGSFSVQLTASTDFSPSRPYTLRCTWFAFDVNEQKVPAGWAEWTFTAVAGGGPIRDMVTAPVSTWFIGPPWPATPVIGAFYLNREGQMPWFRYEP
ncbi:hypothetical protein ACFZA2_10345 [Microbacterium sp. NPDC007973]|uniref:hypothetical protein n=1 Tax=Microbacterium sp. NPDC007973 TaxID=3364182 RepID=UPI0036E54138